MLNREELERLYAGVVLKAKKPVTPLPVMHVTRLVIEDRENRQARLVDAEEYWVPLPPGLTQRTRP